MPTKPGYASVHAQPCFQRGGLGELKVMSRASWVMQHQDRVLNYPCLPGALAKAAASGRASSERGADFCCLHLPRP